MHRFLSNVVGNFRLTNAARPARRTPRRTSLQLEGLESRTVMSTTATQAGSALFVNVDPGFLLFEIGHGPIEHIHQLTFQSDPHQAGKMDVIDDGNALGQPFTIASIQSVKVNVAGFDAVNIDDSNGLPFAARTTISLSGSGNFNSLNLTGSLTISDREMYTAGTGTQGGSLSLGAVTFEFSDVIGSVTDEVKTTDRLNVSTSGPDVSLSGSDGVTQTLSGLGSAGGTLTYSNKNEVDLDSWAANASVSLKATERTPGEQSFGLILYGDNDEAFLQATPNALTTSVLAYSKSEFVYLETNAGPVFVAGNSSTNVTLGDGQSTTGGIRANVTLSTVGHLTLADNGNVWRQEHVTVTESTISGTGLFGNDAVTLTYRNTAYVNTTQVAILTGQLADTYSVVGSQPGAFFGNGNTITIDDFSRVGLNVLVALDGDSDLSLFLNNTFQANPAPASLFISAPGGTFSNPTAILPSLNLPAGAEFVTFAGGLTSKVVYNGFTSVTHS
jgi:hypothetical protein